MRSYFGAALAFLAPDHWLNLREWWIQPNTSKFCANTPYQSSRNASNAMGALCRIWRPKIVRRFLEKKGAEVLEWPGNAPKMNPIGNLWAFAKPKARKMHCSSRKELMEAMRNVWENNPGLRSACENLVLSTPKRVKSLIQARAGHIKY